MRTMPSRSLPLLLLAAVLQGCAFSSTRPVAFVPGVQGRSADEVCQSTSPACQRWTELARKCEANMRAIEAGDLTPKQPYCSEMEKLRESATGIELSSDPGAYAF